MRRSPLRRKAPLRSRPVRRVDAPAVEREPKPLAKATRRGVYAGAVQPAKPKEELIQHSGYMDAVRQLPCAHCGKPGPSQFCHSDLGKGTGIKSDCREGWPGCADCHYAIGTARVYAKPFRRVLEANYAARTRASIIAAGKWPAKLPRWTEE